MTASASAPHTTCRVCICPFAGENKQQQALEKTKTQAEYDSKRECAAHDMQSLHLPICDNVIDDIDGKQGHG